MFVTPGPATERGALARVCAFWGALGALVEVMDPEEHDQILAVTSHLPHLASSALAAILRRGFRKTCCSRQAFRGRSSLWKPRRRLTRPLWVCRKS